MILEQIHFLFSKMSTQVEGMHVMQLYIYDLCTHVMPLPGNPFCNLR